MSIPRFPTYSKVLSQSKSPQNDPVLNQRKKVLEDFCYNTLLKYPDGLSVVDLSDIICQTSNIKNLVPSAGLTAFLKSPERQNKFIVEHILSYAPNNIPMYIIKNNLSVNTKEDIPNGNKSQKILADLIARESTNLASFMENFRCSDADVKNIENIFDIFLSVISSLFPNIYQLTTDSPYFAQLFSGLGQIKITLQPKIMNHNTSPKISRSAFKKIYQKIKSPLKSSGIELTEYEESAPEMCIYFYHLEYKLCGDIRAYDSKLYFKNKLIQAYSNLHPHIYLMLLTIKIWANFKKVDDYWNNSIIDLYAHFFIFIAYLQSIGAVPNLQKLCNRHVFYAEPDHLDWDFYQTFPNTLNQVYQVGNSTHDSCIDCGARLSLISSNPPVPFCNNSIRFGWNPVNWDPEIVIQGFFEFMAFKFDYFNWAIDIRQGGFVDRAHLTGQLSRVKKLTHTSLMLCVLNPTDTNRPECKVVHPWCVDGLKCEYKLAYEAIRNKDYHCLITTPIDLTAQAAIDHNVYSWVNELELGSN